jgi:diguanylate cyclase (GGDEF)-like protein
MARPRRLLRFGIRQKVVLVLLVVLLTALSVSGWLVLRDVERNVLSETQRRGVEMAEYLSRSLAYSVVGYDYHTIQLLLDQIVQAGDVVHVRVLSDRGNAMAEVQHPDRAGVERVSFDRPVTVNGQPVGHLELELSIEPIVRQLAAQKHSLVKREALVIVLIAFGEFLVLSWIIIGPLTRVSRVLESNVDEHGVILRDIPVESRDEIGELARRFNQMRAQLNAATEKLHSRVQAADEELREAYHQLLEQSAALQRSNLELERLSMTDPLTGLGNRRYFDQSIEPDLAMFRRHGEPGSLLVMDMDRFKTINDNYGHDVGDLILCQFAELLVQHLRETDTVCRLGGEEFAVFLRRTDGPTAMCIAEKLRRAVEEMNVELDDGIRVPVTVSIGVASLSAELRVTTDVTLYKAADSAMYISKQTGRNRVTHYEGLEVDEVAASVPAGEANP